MDVIQLCLICAAVFIGATAQRMTGLGFALVAAPFLVVISGPSTGVALGNALSAILCLTVLVTTWRNVRWKRVLILLAPALVSIPLGAYVVETFDVKIVLIAIGTMATLSVMTVIAGDRLALLPGKRGAVVGGALSGFMNSAAGVGGPMVAVHSMSERWTREVFVGTAQVFLLVVNIFSLAFKGIPTALPLWVWGATGAALVAGAVLGHFISPHVSPKLGQRLVVSLALLGSVAAVVRGATM